MERDVTTSCAMLSTKILGLIGLADKTTNGYWIRWKRMRNRQKKMANRYILENDTTFWSWPPDRIYEFHSSHSSMHHYTRIRSLSCIWEYIVCSMWIYIYERIYSQEYNSCQTSVTGYTYLWMWSNDLGIYSNKKKRLAILPSKYMHNSIYKHYIMNMLDAKCRMRHNTTGHPTTNNKNDDNNNDDEIAHTHLYRHVMHSFCLFFTKLNTRAQKTLCCGAMQPKWLFSLFACRWSRCARLVLSAS